MFAICIEASHKRGMGHLYRMINFAQFLAKKNQNFIFLINENQKAKEILQIHNFPFTAVQLDDMSSDWETLYIKKHNITYWINDRLDTHKTHAKNIIKNQVKLITFDDLGEGSKYSDINICGLFHNQKNLQGKIVLNSNNYLILNPQIDMFKKQRATLKNILVTLGGSDTYGVSIKVLKILKEFAIKATLHIGPSFAHHKELDNEITNDYQVINSVPSLIEEFSQYDLAITGGGVTPYEANASGLPCMIIANETFEIPTGEYLHSLGSSVFLGFHENINKSVFKNLEALNIKQMSQNGLSKLNTGAIEKIYKEIIQL